jgi:hypothetical protein
MAGFDKELDKELFSESVDFERSKITVGVYSYNENTPKLQIGRQSKKADGSLGFAKLGRMTGEEVKAVLPLIQKAMEHLEA